MINKVSKGDWQFLVPILICGACFFAKDFFGSLDQESYAYWSGRLLVEPYRIVTTHFIHGDADHLLSNIFGIVVARYCLKGIGLKDNYFFIYLVILMIPIQTFIFWAFDIFLFKNPMSLAIGFSGVIYGVDAFILLASSYGKQHFLGIQIQLIKSYKIRQIMIVIIGIGVFGSFIPGISLLGHIAGLLAGLILFLL